MQIERLAAALRVAHKFDLDAVDICIIAQVVLRGEATIMAFASDFELASFGTVHARIKRMVQAGLLVKSVSSTNQRYRPIKEGPKLKKFLDSLTDIT